MVVGECVCCVLCRVCTACCVATEKLTDLALRQSGNRGTNLRQRAELHCSVCWVVNRWTAIDPHTVWVSFYPEKHFVATIYLATRLFWSFSSFHIAHVDEDRISGDCVALSASLANPGSYAFSLVVDEFLLVFLFVTYCVIGAVHKLCYA